MGASCGWTSRATSGRSSSRAPDDLERLLRGRHPRDAAVPPAPEQIAEQIAAGRTIIVELDSWYLPDTAATSYRTAHVKIVGRRRGDRPRRRAAALLPQRRPARAERRGLPRRLPPRARVLGRRPAAVHRDRRFDAGGALHGDELRDAARELCAHHLALRPGRTRSRASPRSSSATCPALLEGDAQVYHAYAFATVRMVGAGFEVAARACRLAARRHGRRGVGGAARARRGVPRCCRSSSRAPPCVRPGAGDRGAGRFVGAGDGAARCRVAGLTRRRTRASAAPRARRRARRLGAAAHGAGAARRPRAARRRLDRRAGARARSRRAARRRRARGRRSTSDDWWFRTRFDAPARDGERARAARSTASRRLAEVCLNGEPAAGERVDVPAHAVPVGAPLPRRATSSRSAAARWRRVLRDARKPRARWRTRLVDDGNLRFFRTMLLGRVPGFAPGPAAVGPVARRSRSSAAAPSRSTSCALRAARSRATTACSSVRCAALGAALGADRAVVELDGPSTAPRAALRRSRDGRRRAARRAAVPGVARWWPHTHGEPALHDVGCSCGGRRA